MVHCIHRVCGDSMDRIKEHCELPELDVGEWVYFEGESACLVLGRVRIRVLAKNFCL